MARYVICPATITSPAPAQGFISATGLGANHPCGNRIDLPDEIADYKGDNTPILCRCPYGHQFYAGKIQHD
ncbi:MAG: hypothetical protein KGL39_46475 [Patescibacteria group bacterium]|nr:hypothetical protein [Patescibacteria group bacterium]